MSQPISPEQLQILKDFFEGPVAQQGTTPLSNGVEIGIVVAETSPVTLAKSNGVTQILERGPKVPDITMYVPEKALEKLQELQVKDVGTLGVEILKLMSHPDVEYKIRPKVHIGLLSFLSHGYLGILPLGGRKIMEFLAAKGFTGIGKIRKAISNLRK